MSHSQIGRKRSWHLWPRVVSNKDIAETVFLAEGTVKNYVSKIMEKLHVGSRTELAIKALKRKKL